MGTTRQSVIAVKLRSFVAYADYQRVRGPWGLLSLVLQWAQFPQGNQCLAFHEEKWQHE